MKSVVYLDHEQCLMIFKQASENNGRVVIEAKGFSPFEIAMDPVHAKKVWDELEKKYRNNDLYSQIDWSKLLKRRLDELEREEE